MVPIMITPDPVFNYFFSMGVYWAFTLGGFFSVLSLFRA